MSYDDFKQLPRKSWEDEYKIPFVDRSKKKNEGVFCFCNESKKTYIECTPKRNPLQVFQVF